jgi:carboxypeptidase Taq
MHLNIPKKVQKALIHEFLGWMRLPEDKVRLSSSPHPFTTGIAPSDVRITTRYTETLESFFTAIHEAGHALYELGLPNKYVNTFIYTQASYGIDESQALFWEYHIAKSRTFWEAYWSLFVEQTGIAVDLDTFYKEVNLVRPSFIRVNADEVTYPLHIILRYDIEKLLLSGALKPKGAKGVWNKMMKELLNITPRSDNEGILQDIHWATGDFGYFPTYALGNIYAAMIRKQIGKEIKEFDRHTRALDFNPAIKWLIHHIHRKGKTQTPSTLMRRVCGSELQPKVFLTYLKEKYEEIYNF